MHKDRSAASLEKCLLLTTKQCFKKSLVNSQSVLLLQKNTGPIFLIAREQTAKKTSIVALGFQTEIC